jgi:hypothetical protein
MKPLLFTFFAIVLCYSLFCNDEPNVLGVDELNYIYEEILPDIDRSKDTSGAYLYACFVVDRMDMMRFVYGERQEEDRPFDDSSLLD